MDFRGDCSDPRASYKSACRVLRMSTLAGFGHLTTRQYRYMLFWFLARSLTLSFLLMISHLSRKFVEQFDFDGWLHPQMVFEGLAK